MSQAAPPASSITPQGNSGDDTPVPGDPTGIGGAEDAGTLGLGTSWAYLADARPGSQLARAGVGLGADSVRRSPAVVTPDRGDWRFADPTWQENPAYRRLMQLYLTWCRTLEELVERPTSTGAPGSAPASRSPSSPHHRPDQHPARQPGGDQARLRDRRRQLRHRLRQMVHDLRHNGGLPSQVDPTAFTSARTSPSAPGAVVYRDEVLRDHPVHPDHADGALPSGGDGAAADQQVLLHGPRPGPQLHRVRGVAGLPSSRSAGATPVAQGSDGTSTPTRIGGEGDRRRARDHRERQREHARDVRRGITTSTVLSHLALRDPAG